MGRVYDTIRINGRDCLALFDSGARNTFVLPSVAALCKTVRLKKALPVAIGGRRHKSRRQCTMEGSLKGKHLVLSAFVFPDIGRGDKDRPIEILVGALAMQQWGIELDLRKEEVDLSHYPREFVEF